MTSLPSNPPTAQPAPRLSWGARIVICLVLFHMFFRSTDVLYPWSEWAHDLKIKRMPKPLPTHADIDKKMQEAAGSYEPVVKEFRECFASLPRYWCPWPTEETRALLAAQQIRWGKLRLNPASAKQRDELKLPDASGLVVMEVEDESPEAKAGLKAEDVLIRVNRRAIPTDPAALAELAASEALDAELAFVVWRDGAEKEIKPISMPPDVTSSPWINAGLWLKYALAWTATRLQWCECVLNIDQEWPMFSPNVGRKKFPARARLLYADGTEKTIPQRSDPVTLTSYFRWSPGKNLGYDRGVDANSGHRWYACPGWCNYLSHQHPVNENGAKLKEIRIYQVTYNFPPPDEDARAYLEKVMERTRDHNSSYAWPTFFVYNPENREWHFCKNE